MDFNSCKEAAEKGDTKAQYLLGRMYQIGINVKKDMLKSFEWYTKAAEQGNPFAQYRLGEKDDYENGDYTKAFEWYTKAAKNGVAEAQYRLGKAYFYGRGVAQDIEKAIEWSTKATEQGIALCCFKDIYKHEKHSKYFNSLSTIAEQGNVDAQFKLGFFLLTQCFVVNFKNAFTWFEKAAEQGHTIAQFFLGYMYLGDYGVAEDYFKAFEWFTKAAEQGHSTAQFYLAELYRNGYGVPRDYDKAIKWYSIASENGNLLATEIELSEIINLSKLAEKGDVEAQFQLAKIYSQRGAHQDWIEKIKWLTKAAEQGHLKAQFELGVSYIIDSDYYESPNYENGTKAFYYFKQAADQGHVKALYNLAHICHHSYMLFGTNDDKTIELAKSINFIELYIKAAEQGNIKAQYNLGYLYYYGEFGVSQDYNKAFYYYNMAAKQGDAKSQYHIAKMYYQGFGVSQDYKEAIKWFTKVTEHKDENEEYEAVQFAEFYLEHSDLLKDISKYQITYKNDKCYEKEEMLDFYVHSYSDFEEDDD